MSEVELQRLSGEEAALRKEFSMRLVQVLRKIHHNGLDYQTSQMVHAMVGEGYPFFTSIQADWIYKYHVRILKLLSQKHGRKIFQELRNQEEGIKEIRSINHLRKQLKINPKIMWQVLDDMREMKIINDESAQRGETKRPRLNMEGNGIIIRALNILLTDL